MKNDKYNRNLYLDPELKIQIYNKNDQQESSNHHSS